MDKYLYLLEQNDLTGISNEFIEESIRQSGLDTFCNKPDEYLNDVFKEYLNRTITFEPNTITDTRIIIITIKTYIKHIFTNFKFTSENNNEMTVTKFLNYVYEKNNYLTLELRIRASKIVFGNYYFKKIIYKLNVDEINLFIKMVNINYETLEEEISRYKDSIIGKFLQDPDTLNEKIKIHTMSILNKRFLRYKKNKI